MTMREKSAKEGPAGRHAVSVAQSWREEKQSAWLYRIVAACEPDPKTNMLFAALADAAESQARLWEAQMERAGQAAPAPFRPSLRAQLVARLIRGLGPRRLRPVLAAMKLRGMSLYGAPPMGPGHPMPTSVEEVGRRHRSVTAGGNLRAAVFGINDGLVSNTSLIMGVAGATGDAEMILIAGVAGLLAGALSMAAGEYVSVRSQRELYESQIALEREEVREYPEEEAEELALIYSARGLPLAEARRIAAGMMQDPEHALNVLAREELGLNPDDLGSPWGATAFSFTSFAIGGAVPVLPFLYTTGPAALPGTIVLAGCALFAVGATISLFTGRGAWWGGLRMLLIGGGAGLATYVIGSLLGIGLG
jgi:vacuolar iron transporter family protein